MWYNDNVKRGRNPADKIRNWRSRKMKDYSRKIEKELNRLNAEYKQAKTAFEAWTPDDEVFPHWTVKRDNLVLDLSTASERLVTATNMARLAGYFVATDDNGDYTVDPDFKTWRNRIE